MSLKRVLYIVVGTCFIILMAFFLIQSISLRPDQENTSQHLSADKTPDIFRLEGVDYTSYEGEKKLFRLQAKSFEVSKRKYGMFYLNPLREASLSKVNLEIYNYSDSKVSHNNFASIPEETLMKILPEQDIKNQGVITRVKIDVVKINLYRDGHFVSSMTAQNVTIDPRRRTAKFNGDFSAAAAGGKSIQGQEVIWDQTAKFFRIQGPYVLIDRGKVIRGNDLRFDLELQEFRS